MVLSLYVIITWLTITSFVFFPRKISLIANIFIYIMLTTIIINKITIVSLNLEFVEITKDPNLYLSHLLTRNIITPFVLLLFCNIFYATKKQTVKYGTAFIALITLIFIEYLGISFDIYTYKKWSLFIEIFIFVIYIIITLFLAKWFRKLLKKEVSIV